MVPTLQTLEDGGLVRILEDGGLVRTLEDGGLVFDFTLAETSESEIICGLALDLASNRERENFDLAVCVAAIEVVVEPLEDTDTDR